MKSVLYLLTALLWLQGCTGVNTFPAIARAGDTVSMMVGSSELARKTSVGGSLIDASGASWDLQANGLIRSVFNLRPDGRAVGLHYSPYLDTFISWFNGHEPLQTVLVVDLPVGTAPGPATLKLFLNAGDNSSGISDPFTVRLDIIAGSGTPERFLRQGIAGYAPVDFQRLEPAPYAKITFGTGTEIVGAASLVVDFDETVVNPADINLYVPESTVRGSVVSTGAFGATQRMVYWWQDGLQLHVEVIAPQGIQTRYLQLYAIHPAAVSGSVNFALTSATVYDTSGNVITVPVNLTYSP